MSTITNLFPQEPQLKDLLDLALRQASLNTNCHAVGTVQDFDPTTQVASVTINYKKTVNQPNVVTGVYAQKLVDYPLIVDAPVIALGGGGFALTMPIAVGDECLVLFNDRDIDNWFATGATGAAVDTGRAHSFSDAIVLVGLRSTPNVVLDYDADGIALRNKLGTVKVKVTDASIKLSNGAAASIEVTSSETKIMQGNVTFEVKADKTVTTLPGGVTFEVDATGKWKLQNTGGDFVTEMLACLNALAIGTAGGFPILPGPDFAVNYPLLQTFKP